MSFSCATVEYDRQHLLWVAACHLCSESCGITPFGGAHLDIILEVFHTRGAWRSSGGMRDGTVFPGSPLLHDEGPVLETGFSGSI